MRITNLQRLRRAAGYRSAKDFAEALDIPGSTYSRYERDMRGSGCGIPVQAAWAIADELGCSIDLVVGRESLDDDSGKRTLEKRADALSDLGRAMLLDYLGFLEYRERPESARSPRYGREGLNL